MNLPVPSAPTDNLYKFIALSGVALIVTGQFLPLGMVREINDKMADVRGAHITATAEAESQDLLEAEFQDTLAELRAVAKDGELRQAAGEVLAEVKKLHQRYHERLERKILLSSQAKFKESQLEFLQEEYGQKRRFGNVLSVLGLLLGALGFWRWYAIYQRPMDKKAELELAELVAERGLSGDAAPDAPE